MKINELMQGNWVIAPNLKGELREVKVITIKKPPLTDGEYIVDNYGNATFTETLAPIPITEDFFRKNLFNYACVFNPNVSFREGIYNWEKEVDGYFLSIRKCANHKGCDWCIHIDNADRCGIGCMDIQYVHQLQNMLNILGIEMEVVL